MKAGELQGAQDLGVRPNTGAPPLNDKSATQLNLESSNQQTPPTVVQDSENVAQKDESIVPPIVTPKKEEVVPDS